MIVAKTMPFKVAPFPYGEHLVEIGGINLSFPIMGGRHEIVSHPHYAVLRFVDFGSSSEGHKVKSTLKFLIFTFKSHLHPNLSGHSLDFWIVDVSSVQDPCWLMISSGILLSNTLGIIIIQ